MLCTPTDLAREVWRIEPLRNGERAGRRIHRRGAPIYLTFRVGGEIVPHVPVSIVERVQRPAVPAAHPLPGHPRPPRGTVTRSRRHAQSINGYSAVERQAVHPAGQRHLLGRAAGDRAGHHRSHRRCGTRRRGSTNRKVGNLPVLGAGLQVRQRPDRPHRRAVAGIPAVQQPADRDDVRHPTRLPRDVDERRVIVAVSYANSQDNDRRFRRNCLAAFTQQMSDAFSHAAATHRRSGSSSTTHDGRAKVLQTTSGARTWKTRTNEDGTLTIDGIAVPWDDRDRPTAGCGNRSRRGAFDADGGGRQAAAVVPQPRRAGRATSPRPRTPTKGLRDHGGRAAHATRAATRSRSCTAVRIIGLSVGFDPIEMKRGEGRGRSTRHGAPARTVTHPAARIPAGSGDSNKR